MIKILLYQILFTFIALIILSCQDKYLTVERNTIDSENNIPIYFWAEAEQAGVNTWHPIFYYYIYSLEEGEYDAYFHAYVVDNNDSILWTGIQPITIEGGKKIWGEYVSDVEFSPYMMPNIIPMAYVSVSY
tara:strand:- start:459 stop:851 length:393 start_codon:yes stop_codon:yes gene_type:complete